MIHTSPSIKKTSRTFTKKDVEQNVNSDVIPTLPSKKTSSRTFTKNEVEQKVNFDSEPVCKVFKESTDSTVQKHLEDVKKSLDDDKKGFYYGVYYGNNYYWGKVLHVFSDDGDNDADQVEMTFLQYKSDRIWVFPKKIDKDIISVKYIFLGPVSPAAVTVSGYRFNENDIEAKNL